MATFTIEGNSFKYRFWKKRYDRAQRMIKRYEDTVVDISSILIPTPSLMVIKFTTTNNGNKYELTIQGKYSPLYKKIQDDQAIQPDEVNAQLLIVENFEDAFQINE